MWCADAVKSSVVSGKVGWLLCFIVIISVVRERDEESSDLLISAWKCLFCCFFFLACWQTLTGCVFARESHPLFHVLRMTQNLGGGFSSMAAIFLWPVLPFVASSHTLQSGGRAASKHNNCRIVESTYSLEEDLKRWEGMIQKHFLPSVLYCVCSLLWLFCLPYLLHPSQLQPLTAV